jgi:hypothetical protein
MFAKFFIAEYGTATPWEEDIDIYLHTAVGFPPGGSGQ